MNSQHGSGQHFRLINGPSRRKGIEIMRSAFLLSMIVSDEEPAGARSLLNYSSGSFRGHEITVMTAVMIQRRTSAAFVSLTSFQPFPRS